MSSINDLKNALSTKTTNLALLNIATAGIFPIMWLYRHTATVERITKRKIADDTFLIWLAVCTGLGLLLRMIGGGDGTLAALAGIGVLLQIAGGVLCVIWAFRARKALEHYALHEHRMDLNMNTFYTVVFNVFYINYCINDLPELAHKKQVLSSATPPTESQG